MTEMVVQPRASNPESTSGQNCLESNPTVPVSDSEDYHDYQVVVALEGETQPTGVISPATLCTNTNYYMCILSVGMGLNPLWI